MFVVFNDVPDVFIIIVDFAASVVAAFILLRNSSDVILTAVVNTP